MPTSSSPVAWDKFAAHVVALQEYFIGCTDSLRRHLGVPVGDHRWLWFRDGYYGNRFQGELYFPRSLDSMAYQAGILTRHIVEDVAVDDMVSIGGIERFYAEQLVRGVMR